MRGLFIDFMILLVKFDAPIFEAFVRFSVAEFVSSALKHKALRVVIIST